RSWIGPGHMLPPYTTRIANETYVLAPNYTYPVHPLHASLDGLGDLHAPPTALPPLIAYRIGIPLDEATRTEYESAVLTRVAGTNQYSGSQFVNLKNPLAQLTYLLQLCADPRLAVRAVLESPNVRRFKDQSPDPPRGGKVEVLRTVCEEARRRGLKVVAFTEYARLAHILEEDDLLAPYRPLTATGDIPRKALHAHIREFLEGEDRTLLLATRVAREGLNLQGASVVVLYGKVGWNPQDLEQAVARLHRRGQGRTVLAFWLYAPDTVEEDLKTLYLHKAWDFAQAVRGKDMPDSPLLRAKPLSPSDIPSAFSQAYGD
ncbi:MAG: helicase-related protein, partial [Anaerolineae bacterium]